MFSGVKRKGNTLSELTVADIHDEERKWCNL